MKPPAFQLYAADFYMDTNAWTPEEVGIYFRLLLSEWVNGPLQNDPKRLARIAGIGSKKWPKRWTIIASKFSQNGDGKLYNKRLEEEREIQRKYRELQTKKGKMGGRPKKSCGFSPDLTGLKPEESSSSSSSINTKKKIYKRKDVTCLSTIPEDFQISDKVFSWFVNKYPNATIDLETEKEQFVNYWLSEGKRKKNWDATFRNRIIYIITNQRQTTPKTTPLNTLEDGEYRPNPITGKTEAWDEMSRKWLSLD